MAFSRHLKYTNRLWLLVVSSRVILQRGRVVIPLLVLSVCTLTVSAQNSDTQQMLVIQRGAEFQASGETVAPSEHGSVVTVTKTNGQWKWVPAAKGWIRDRDVVSLDSAVDTLSGQLRTQPRNAQVYINRAAAYRATGDLAKAITDLDEAVRLDSESALAFTLRGICHSESANLDASIDDLKRAVRLDSKYLRPVLALGLSLRMKGEPAAAIEQLTEALRLDPTSHSAYLERARAWIDRGELDIALSDVNDAIRLRPDSAAAYRQRASIWRNKQEAQKELNDLNEAVRIDPQDVDALILRGNLWRLNGNPDNAIADFNNVIKINPQLSGAFNLRAITRESKNEIAEALKDYDAAIGLAPENTVYLMNRADTLKKTGELQKAWNDVTSVLAKYKELGDEVAAKTHAFAWFERSNILRQAGQPDDALSDLTEAIRIYPDYSDAYNNRGLIREAKKEFDAALEDYQEASRLNPNNAIPHFNIGDVFRVQGKNQEALNAYSKAIELNPNYAVAFNNRGLIWEGVRNYDNALADYNAALAINPQLSVALGNRGDVWRARGETQNAINDYSAAIAINDSAPYVYVGRAQAYLAQGDQDSLTKGFADCSKAITLNDKYALAFVVRGIIRRSQDGDQFAAGEAAIEDFTTAIAINPQYIGAYNERGHTKSLLGGFESAVTDFTEALKLDPKHPFALHHRGVALRIIGELDRAVEDLNAVLSIDATYSGSYRERAIARAGQGDYELAIADYRKAIELDPEDDAAHHRLARLLAIVPDDGLRNGDQALTHVTKALELTGNTIAEYLGTLAAVHAELGDFDQAIEIQTRLADEGLGDPQELEFYRAGKPYRMGAELPIEIEPYPEVAAVTALANAINTDFIPAEAFAAIVLSPSAILKTPLLSPLPAQLFIKELTSEMPMDPRELEEVVVVMFPHQKLPPGFILRFHGESAGMPDAKLGDLAEENVKSVELDGKSYLTDGSEAVFRVDSQTVIVGPETAVTRMMRADNTPSVLRNTLQQTEAGAPLFATAALSVCPRFIASVTEEAPPDMEDVATLIPHCSEFNVRLTLDPAFEVVATANMEDNESAARLNLVTIQRIGQLRQLHESVQAQVAAMIPAPFGEQLNNFATELLTSTSPTMAGNAVSVSIAEPDELAAWLNDSAPAIAAVMGQARAAAQGAQSMNGLKQILLAFHTYHDVHGHFPARASFDESGKSMLSWRVHLLPYLEHQALYEQFHLDEPWDSQHNLSLLTQMPDVYQNTQPRDDGHTTFVVPVGEGTMFESTEGIEMSSITDGLSNTVMVVSADTANAVEWTKPETTNFNPDQPFAVFKAYRVSSLAEVTVGFADGSARTLPSTISAESLRAVLTHNGGELAELE